MSPLTKITHIMPMRELCAVPVALRKPVHARSACSWATSPNAKKDGGLLIAA